jgi:methionine-rich copper-binding protein CopC
MVPPAGLGGKYRSKPELDHTMTRLSRILSFAAVASLALSGTAFAHAHLKSSVPADRATVKVAPTELDLTFSEELNLKFTGVKIMGLGKAEVKTGTATLMDADKGLMVPLSQKLDAGAYTVEWHALSADGHKTNGKYSFTIAP